MNAEVSRNGREYTLKLKFTGEEAGEVANDLRPHYGNHFAHLVEEIFMDTAWEDALEEAEEDDDNDC